MNLWLRLHGFEPCSWTFVWQNLRETFESMGIVVYGFEDPADAEDCIEIWWGDPQFWRWSDLPVRHRVAIALSEARSIRAGGRETVIQNLQESELIICPSESAATAFREAPIEAPIRVVSFGVDPKEFHYTERNWSEERTLKFLHGGVPQYRKGSWLVPEAFVKAFPKKEDVELTICALKVSSMFTDLKMEYESHPKMTFNGDLQESPMVWYKSHHILVSPHLSEGFGLMIPEAMATGMACLVARCSAPREYFSSQYGWWVEMSEIYGPIEACMPETAGFWRVPDPNSLAEMMAEVYDNRSLAKQKGQAASRFVLENMTWEHMCRGILSAIEEVLDVESFCCDDGLQRGTSVTSRLEEY